MLSPESAWALVQKFPHLSSSERDELLLWARETPLLYGAWKPWKKLFKTLDQTAKSGQKFDVELLGVLLARIDKHVVAPPAPRLTLNPDAPEAKSAKEARGATHLFKIGGRNDYDPYGWRITATPLSAPQTLMQKIGLGAPAASARQTWDFHGRDYFYQLKSAKLQGAILSIEGQYRDMRHQIDVSDPAFLHLVESGPTRETWGYIKRRARRLLRELEPHAEYWPLLLSLLRASGPEPFAPAWQWATADALFGGGPRLKQKGHGRSTVEFSRTLWHRRREERAPSAWDAHRDEVRLLAQDETVSVAANAVALNVLRADESLAPIFAEISTYQLQRFLGGEAAWLRSEAAREALRRWQNGAVPSGAIAAQLAVSSGARNQKAARALLETLGPQTPAWQSEFAAPLSALLDAAALAPTSGALQRRARQAGFFLATRARDGIGDEAFWKNLALWLTLETELGAEFSAWIETRIAAAGKAGHTQRLADVARLEQAARDRAFACFARQAATHKPNKNAAIALVTNGEVELNRLGWRYLAATAIDTQTVNAIWKQFFSQYFQHSVLSAAFSDESAALFRRATWTEKDIASLWGESDAAVYRQAWSFIVPHASPEFFQAWIAVSAAEDVARRIFKTLSYLPKETSHGVVAELLPHASGFAPEADAIRAALAPTYFYFAATDRVAALRFLAASDVEKATLGAVWKEIFALDFAPEAAAPLVELLRRAELSSDEIGEWMKTQFERIEKFPPDFLAALLVRSPAALLDGTLRAGENQLPALRVLLHKQLGDASFRASFWNALWPLLGDETQREAIRKNLLSDEIIARSFTLLEDVGEFFATDEEAHEPLLLAWLDAHLVQLQQGDTTLLLAATCPLTSVHRRALARIEELGLSLALALRLLESKLPPAMLLARAWMENSSPENETERALVLCDSPDLDVQKVGREFVLARRERLLNGETLVRLAENTSAPMQAWVAAQLETTDVSTVLFDRTVLRARGRNREAKERVKSRLNSSDATSQTATATLLELARGRTARDREWALQQLAKQMVAGEKIDGVQLLNE